MTTDTDLTGTLFRDGRWDREAVGHEAYETFRKGMGFPALVLTWDTIDEPSRDVWRTVGEALAARIAREPAWVIGAGVLATLEGASDDAG